MTFEIDPCKSVLNNMLCDNNINTMNNLCYEISSAYGKVYGDETHKKLKYKCTKNKNIIFFDSFLCFFS